MTENCKNEAFWGFWKILFPLKNANLYLLEPVRLALCCFGKNLIDGPTFEKFKGTLMLI